MKSLIVLNWINSVIMGFLQIYNGMDEFPWNIARRNISPNMDVNMLCDAVMARYKQNTQTRKKGSKLFRKELTSNEHRLTGFNANQNAIPHS